MFFPGSETISVAEELDNIVSFIFSDQDIFQDLILESLVYGFDASTKTQLKENLKDFLMGDEKKIIELLKEKKSYTKDVSCFSLPVFLYNKDDLLAFVDVFYDHRINNNNNYELSLDFILKLYKEYKQYIKKIERENEELDVKLFSFSDFFSIKPDIERKEGTNWEKNIAEIIERIGIMSSSDVAGSSKNKKEGKTNISKKTKRFSKLKKEKVLTEEGVEKDEVFF